jgi:hypothetical protein
LNTDDIRDNSQRDAHGHEYGAMWLLIGTVKQAAEKKW